MVLADLKYPLNWGEVQSDPLIIDSLAPGSNQACITAGCGGIDT